MATQAELKARLAEAEAALHQIALGGGVRRVRDSNGEEIEYSSANRGALQAYIAALRYELGLDAPGPLNAWV